MVTPKAPDLQFPGCPTLKASVDTETTRERNKMGQGRTNVAYREDGSNTHLPDMLLTHPGLLEGKIPRTKQCKAEAVHHREKHSTTERNQVPFIKPIIFRTCALYQNISGTVKISLYYVDSNLISKHSIGHMAK